MRDKRPTPRALLLIAFGSFLCVGPMLLWGYHEGADLNVHLESWIDASQQFRQGILFPRWAANANYGFGEPRFIFYPPLSWMIGGVLGLLLPWTFVPPVYSWLVLALAGGGMWSLAREWFSPGMATIAAVLYAFNPFTISTIYNRSDFAELLASAFFPLLLKEAIRFTEGRKHALVPLAAVFAAIWLSNFPAAVIATYSLGLILAIQACSLRSWRVLVRGCGAILLGFGLAAFIVFPALWEQKWINIHAVIRPVLRPDNNFLFGPMMGDANMHRFNHKVSMLAIVLSGFAAIATFLAPEWRQQARRIWVMASLLAAVSIFMMTPLSLPLWHLLPKLEFVQFPWRWLLVLCVVGTLLGAAALSQLRRGWLAWGVAAVFLVTLNLPVIHTTTWSFHPVTDVVQEATSGKGYDGLVEYAPAGADISRILPGAPDVTIADQTDQRVSQQDDVKLRVDAWSAQQKSIFVQTPKPIELNLKLLAYPAWHIIVNQKAESFDSDPSTAEMEVRAPAGTDRIQVVWRQTWDRTAGDIATLLSIAICLLILFLEKRALRSSAGSRRGNGTSARNGTLPLQQHA